MSIVKKVWGFVERTAETVARHGKALMVGGIIAVGGLVGTATPLRTRRRSITPSTAGR